MSKKHLKNISITTWEIDRPVDCQSCIGQMNYANTPKILLDSVDNGSLDTTSPPVVAPRGSVACKWCGIKVTGPSLSESISKWRSLQEVIRLGYSVLNNDNNINIPNSFDKIAKAIEEDRLIILAEGTSFSGNSAYDRTLKRMIERTKEYLKLK